MRLQRGAGVDNASKRLLIVDDEPSILTGMQRFFVAAGYRVDCAVEREEAEALLDHVAYDCLIADLCLTTGHGPDGLALIGHARAISPRTRIVVLTAVQEGATETEARRLGTDAFLRKPAALGDVARVVGELVGAAS